jgi:hypothetical protein
LASHWTGLGWDGRRGCQAVVVGWEACTAGWRDPWESSAALKPLADPLSCEKPGPGPWQRVAGGGAACWLGAVEQGEVGGAGTAVALAAMAAW